jgi:hypothetical protein
MSVSSENATPAARADGASRVAWARDYFWSDNARRVQTMLGLVWLLDGGLQFQSFMYSRGFVQLLAGGGQGQPGWLDSSVNWGARLANGNLDVWNTLFALTQVLIGVGLLYRPLVRPALAGSFLWVLFVWWFGEAFGMMFMTSLSTGGSAPAPMASALTGAPGGVLIYGLIGLVAWPTVRPGGLLGARGARIMWASLWLLMAYLWLQGPSTATNGVSNAINAAPSGMSWLSSVQDWVANGAQGNGLIVSLILAGITAAIGVAVVANWRPREFLALAIVLNLVYWVVGQGFGGIAEGGATDPNAAPLFMLLGYAMYPIIASVTAAEPVTAISSRPTDPPVSLTA